MFDREWHSFPKKETSWELIEKAVTHILNTFFLLPSWWIELIHLKRSAVPIGFLRFHHLQHVDVRTNSCIGIEEGFHIQTYLKSAGVHWVHLLKVRWSVVVHVAITLTYLSKDLYPLPSRRRVMVAMTVWRLTQIVAATTAWQIMAVLVMTVWQPSQVMAATTIWQRWISILSGKKVKTIGIKMYYDSPIDSCGQAGKTKAFLSRPRW